MGLGQELARERCDKAVGRGREGAGAEEGEGMVFGKQCSRTALAGLETVMGQ